MRALCRAQGTRTWMPTAWPDGVLSSPKRELASVPAAPINIEIAPGVVSSSSVTSYTCESTTSQLARALQQQSVFGPLAATGWRC